jgi:hypothetical protein
VRQASRFGIAAGAISCIILLSLLSLDAQTLSDSRIKNAELVYTHTNTGSGTYTNVRVYVGIPQGLPGQTLHSISWTP